MKARRLMWLAVMCASAVAMGDEVLGASPRSFYLELKAGPYWPMIDRPFAGGATLPYRDTFGSRFMWLGEAELDFQFFQKFGTLAVGVSAGYAEKYGSAVIAGTTTKSTTESTGLHVIPLKVLLTYRFDWLNQKFNIPLVPYVKGGPVIIPWWVTKGGDLEVLGSGARGAGYKLGLAATAGLAFCLDVLDRRVARDFDTSMGVNHSYLFAEGTYQDMVLFESKSNTKPLDLSSLHVSFGLGLEF